MLKRKTPMNAVRKQIESSSQVVQKSFGNGSYFCRTQLVLICKQKRFGGLFCYWQSLHILHILGACTQMFACYKQQYMAGCSREDSSGLPWSRSSRETGTAWSVAGLMISSNDILAHMHVWMCVHTQLYVSPYWDRKPLPCCSFNFSINTVYKNCLRQQFPFMFTFLWTVLNQPFKSSVYKLEPFLCGFHIKILRYQPLCR